MENRAERSDLSKTAGDLYNRLSVSDGRVWAEEFMRVTKGGMSGIDTDLMTAWFCNAIMAGYDHGRKVQAHSEKMASINDETEHVEASPDPEIVNQMHRERLDRAIAKLYDIVAGLTERLDKLEQGLSDKDKRLGKWVETYTSGIEELRQSSLRNASLYDDLFSLRERLEDLERQCAAPLSLEVVGDPIADASRLPVRVSVTRTAPSRQLDADSTTYTFGRPPQPTEPVTLNSDGTLPRQPVPDETIARIAEAVVHWVMHGPYAQSDVANCLEQMYQNYYPGVYGSGRGEHTKQRVIADWLKEVLNDAQPN